MFKRLLESAGSDGAAGGGAPVQIDQAIEAEARRSGWRPKEQFTGDPNSWVDAKTFVQRGKEILPHIQRHSARLEHENSQLRTQQTAQQQELEVLREQVQGLTTFRTEMAQRERERLRAEIIAEIKAARGAGDVDAEARAIARLTPAEPARTEPARQAGPRTDTGGGATLPGGNSAERQPARVPQELTDWVGNNDWYQRDPVLQHAMTTVGAELRASGQLNGMSLTDQLNATARVVLDRYTARPVQGARVEGGARPGEGGGSRQPTEGTYESLPPHIKAECDAQGDRLGLIGEKKTFKTKQAWQAHYAREYFRYTPGTGYDYRPPGN